MIYIKGGTEKKTNREREEWGGETRHSPEVQGAECKCRNSFNSLNVKTT